MRCVRASRIVVQRICRLAHSRLASASAVIDAKNFATESRVSVRRAPPNEFVDFLEDHFFSSGAKGSTLAALRFISALFEDAGGRHVRKYVVRVTIPSATVP